METLAVHVGRRTDPATGAVTPPIHLSTQLSSVALTVSIPWDSAIRGRVIRRANPWKNVLPRSKAERKP